MSVFIHQKTGKVVVINLDVLESVGPEHNVDGIEKRVNILVFAGIELIFF